MSERIVEADKSIVLAADVEPEAFAPLVSQLDGIEGLSAVKIGFELGYGLRLDKAVDVVHAAGLIAVFDHQKAGNDIPATGLNFGRAMQKGGVDAAILFPFTGPVTQENWTKELQDRGIKVISGGEMTHDQIEASKDGLSGGYVNGVAFERMYARAVELGVREFVVPGNKPDKVAKYKAFFDKEVGEGQYSLWAPGFVDQGGDISETGLVAGPRFHAIVGGGIYKAENPRLAAQNLGQKLLGLEA